MNDNDVIDWVYLRSLSTLQPPDEPDIVAELVEMFLSESADRCAGLQQAVGSGNADEIRRLGHSLRGSAGQIGAAGVARVAARLEASVTGGTVDDGVIALVHDVCGAVREASMALQAGETPT